jgi:uncharacterized cupin superfamily protein
MSFPPFWIGPATAVPAEVDKYDHLAETFTIGRDLSDAAGLTRIGLHWEVLPSGHRSTLPHAEEREEEFVLVVRGSVQAWVDGAMHPMRAGDIAIFRAGTGVAHAIYNYSSEDAVLFVGGERRVPGNRRYYPMNPEMRSIVGEEKWWQP